MQWSRVRWYLLLYCGLPGAWVGRGLTPITVTTGNNIHIHSPHGGKYAAYNQFYSFYSLLANITFNCRRKTNFIVLIYRRNKYFINLVNKILHSIVCVINTGSNVTSNSWSHAYFSLVFRLSRYWLR